MTTIAAASPLPTLADAAAPKIGAGTGDGFAPVLAALLTPDGAPVATVPPPPQQQAQPQPEPQPEPQPAAAGTILPAPGKPMPPADPSLVPAAPASAPDANAGTRAAPTDIATAEPTPRTPPADALRAAAAATATTPADPGAAKITDRAVRGRTDSAPRPARFSLPRSSPARPDSSPDRDRSSADPADLQRPAAQANREAVQASPPPAPPAAPDASSSAALAAIVADTPAPALPLKPRAEARTPSLRNLPASGDASDPTPRPADAVLNPRALALHLGKPAANAGNPALSALPPLLHSRAGGSPDSARSADRHDTSDGDPTSPASNIAGLPNSLAIDEAPSLPPTFRAPPPDARSVGSDTPDATDHAAVRSTPSVRATYDLAGPPIAETADPNTRASAAVPVRDDARPVDLRPAADNPTRAAAEPGLPAAPRARAELRLPGEGRGPVATNDVAASAAVLAPSTVLAPTMTSAAIPGSTAAVSRAAVPDARSSAPADLAAPDAIRARTTPPPRTTTPDPAPATNQPAAILPAFQAFGAALHRAAAAERRVVRTADAPFVAGLAATGPLAPPADAPPVDTARADWPATMISRIEALRDRLAEPGSAADTRIRLHPDALGAVDVTLRHDAAGAHVRLDAAEPAARALLADAQPQLHALAEQRGLRLAADVGGGDAQPGQTWRDDRGQPAPQPTRTRRPAAADDTQADDPADSRLA